MASELSLGFSLSLNKWSKLRKRNSNMKPSKIEAVVERQLASSYGPRSHNLDAIDSATQSASDALRDVQRALSQAPAGDATSFLKEAKQGLVTATQALDRFWRVTGEE